jgi:hypothetical protein
MTTKHPQVMDVNMRKQSTTCGRSKKIATAFKKPKPTPVQSKPGDVMMALTELKSLMHTVINSTAQPQTKIFLPVQTVLLAPSIEPTSTHKHVKSKPGKKKQHEEAGRQSQSNLTFPSQSEAGTST